MELTEKNLKQGYVFVFCTPAEIDDYRELAIGYSRAKNFVVWFNGVLLHSSKTYRSALKKLNDVKNRWGLIFDGVETSNG